MQRTSFGVRKSRGAVPRIIVLVFLVVFAGSAALLVWLLRPTMPFREFQDSSSALELAVKEWRHVEGWDVELAQFETVFWDPQDTTTLRKWLEDADDIEGATVMEIGTGTGLVSFAALAAGASQAVATDINPAACANAIYNAEHLGWSERLRVFQVTEDDASLFSQVPEDLQFDFIISNPPWEDAPVEEVAAYALYDPGFQLLDRLLTQTADRLKARGKLLLAYGSKTAIRRILESAPASGWRVEIADDRDLDALPEVFVPAVLLVLTVSPDRD